MSWEIIMQCAGAYLFVLAVAYRVK